MQYYVKKWTMGLAVNSAGKDVCTLLRFDSINEANQYIDEYLAPNHCPGAFAERVNYAEAKKHFGETWIASDCGQYEIAH